MFYSPVQTLLRHRPSLFSLSSLVSRLKPRAGGATCRDTPRSHNIITENAVPSYSCTDLNNRVFVSPFGIYCLCVKVYTVQPAEPHRLIITSFACLFSCFSLRNTACCCLIGSFHHGTRSINRCAHSSRIWGRSDFEYAHIASRGRCAR